MSGGRAGVAAPVAGEVRRKCLKRTGHEAGCAVRMVAGAAALHQAQTALQPVPDVRGVATSAQQGEILGDGRQPQGAGAALSRALAGEPRSHPLALGQAAGRRGQGQQDAGAERGAGCHQVGGGQPHPQRGLGGEPGPEVAADQDCLDRLGETARGVEGSASAASRTPARTPRAAARHRRPSRATSPALRVSPRSGTTGRRGGRSGPGARGSRRSGRGWAGR